MFKKILTVILFTGAVFAQIPDPLMPSFYDHRAKARDHFRKKRQINEALRNSLTPEKDRNLSAIHGELGGIHKELALAANRPASGKRDSGLRVRLNERYGAVSRLYAVGAEHAKDPHEKIWYKDMAKQYKDESRGGSLMPKASAQQHQRKIVNVRAGGRTKS